MSHITCHECGSQDHIGGYGMAVGGIGTYVICCDCSTVLEYHPDCEGVPEEVAVIIRNQHSVWLKAVNEKRQAKGLPLLNENGEVS